MSIRPKPNFGLTIYLVGPISGLSYDETIDHFNYRKDKLESYGFTVLTPMLSKGHLRNDIKLKAEGYGDPISCNHAIVGRDKWMVKTSNILFADFTKGAKRVSIGSVFELAWGREYGKLIVVVMDKTNIHQHAFIIETADLIFETSDEAIDYFKTYQTLL